MPTMSVTEIGEKYHLSEEIKSEIRRTMVTVAITGVFLGICVVLFELSVMSHV